MRVSSVICIVFVSSSAARVAHDGPYFVHQHSAADRRLAAWVRTSCGSPAVQPPADIITQWGASVTPVGVLAEYPRPQMTRAPGKYYNGLWEFQLGSGFDEPVPFGVTLNQTILVPFPLESCLSGAFQWPAYSKWLWYRALLDAPFSDGHTLLHFGAIDWNATVYLNGKLVGNHLGGYDGFFFDITMLLLPAGNELIVAVYDPSEEGYQVQGKQRVAAIAKPGGDHYTPTSGIWQTVWAESVPAYHVDALRVRGDATRLYLTVLTAGGGAGTVAANVSFGGKAVTGFTGPTGAPLEVEIPEPQLWGPGAPNLYDLAVTVTEAATGRTDSVGSYFGMRAVSTVNFTQPPVPPTGPRVGWDNSGGDLPGMPIALNASDYSLCWGLCNATAACVAWSYGLPSCGKDPATPRCWLKGEVREWKQDACRVAGDMGASGGVALRPAINGAFTFLAGWLDQSWWPDGEYTAPTDGALAFDLQAVLDFGLNAVRLHQKVNSDRWYYWADKLGVVVLQDMIQKFGAPTNDTIAAFSTELQAMIDGRYNHPSIIQWTIFNEGDCVNAFSNVSDIVAWVRAYDPSRLVDTNSGGPANALHVGDVNDIHSYPWPGKPAPSASQYAEIGEFGGLGAFVPGREWAPGQCHTYLKCDSPQQEADLYAQMAGNITLYRDSPGVSVSIYTQITDVENECDGFLNMDRTNKFTPAQVAQIVAANNRLTGAVAQQ